MAINLLLSFWSLWTAFTSYYPLSWRSLFQMCSGVSIVTYRHRKSFLPRLNSSKQRPESSTCCFWSGVSKRGTHFENNLRIPKDSSKIVNTLLLFFFCFPEQLQILGDQIVQPRRCFYDTQNSFLSIVLKMIKVASPKLL